MPRVVVIGDVGGHVGQLDWALRSIGAYGDPLTLPENVVVVQVGDLVDRGPDSLSVLHLVDQILKRQPEQWVQLVGNHEAQYLPGQNLFWPEPLDPAGTATLSRWWDTGLMNVATGIAAEDGDEYLLTHAGLTVGAWQSVDEPMTASTAVWRLNDRPPVIWRGPETPEQIGIGPLWAEAGTELHESWMDYYNGGGMVPYGQIHGHSTIVGYKDQTWHVPGRVRQRAAVDWDARHVRIRIGGRVFIGVDPKHGRLGARRWKPLILDNATILGGVTTPRGLAR